MGDFIAHFGRPTPTTTRLSTRCPISPLLRLSCTETGTNSSPWRFRFLSCTGTSRTPSSLYCRCRATTSSTSTPHTSPHWCSTSSGAGTSPLPNSDAGMCILLPRLLGGRSFSGTVSAPGWQDDATLCEADRSRRRFNRAVGWLTKMGMPLAGSRVLSVRGRTSGEWRSTPVNPFASRVIAIWCRHADTRSGCGTFARQAGGGSQAGGGRRNSESRRSPMTRSPRFCGLSQGVGLGSRSILRGRRRSSPDARLLEIAPDFPVFRIV